MQLNEQVASITRETIIPELFDQVSVGSPFLMFSLMEAIKWTGGKYFELPIKYAKSTVGGTFNIGSTLPSTRQTNRTRLQFEIAGIEKPIVIDDIEHLLNKGPEQVLEAVATEADSMKTDLLDDFAEQLWQGTGTANDWNSMDTAADDGTNFGSYGNKSRTTYDALEGYYLASAGALTLAKMATAYDGSSTGTSDANRLYSGKTVWSGYEDLNQSTVSANYTATGASVMTPEGAVTNPIALQGGMGFQFLTFRGSPLFKDEKCPSGRMYFTNSRKEGEKARNFGLVMADMSGVGPEYSTVNFKNTGGKPKGVFGSRKAPLGFNFRDLMSPVDQLSKVGYVMFLGNAVSAQCRLQGQMRGLTVA